MKKAIVVICILFFNYYLTIGQTAEKVQHRKYLNEKVNIGGVFKGEISKKVILESKGLALDEQASTTYHIAVYKMSLIVSGSAPKEFENKKNGEFTSAMYEEIKNAPIGSKIHFEYIKCLDKNNKTHLLYPVEFILK